MSTICLDTSAYSQAMRGERSAREVVQAADRLLMCPIVVGELLAGFRRGSREKQNRAVLDEFLESRRVETVALTDETSEHYAAVLDGLRKQGTPIPTNDIWIAACAMENGAHVASADSHFRHVNGLVLHSLES